MLKQAKVGVLRLAEATGISRLLAGSAWRRRRLLILCYHGVSKYDETDWGYLYISPEMLRRRLEMLKEQRCTVLPLAEAVTRLQNGTLPDRAVALTFDDGLHDFFSVAFPIIESFGFPVTVYLTTYYVDLNLPVFDPMCSYLLWKARDRETFEWPEVFAGPMRLDEAGRQHAATAIKQFSTAQAMDGRGKDDLLSQLAERLGFNYAELRKQRLLQLITPEEARELAERGVDLEYHTHRHRVYRGRDRMFAELEDNRRHLGAYTVQEPRHFCYPGGYHLPEHPGYLKEFGMLSATTCLSGLCTARTNPMLLPRVVDTKALSEVEFRGWLAGTSQLLPRRSTGMIEGQLVEEGELATA